MSGQSQFMKSGYQYQSQIPFQQNQNQFEEQFQFDEDEEESLRGLDQVVTKPIEQVNKSQPIPRGPPPQSYSQEQQQAPQQFRSGVAMTNSHYPQNASQQPLPKTSIPQTKQQDYNPYQPQPQNQHRNQPQNFQLEQFSDGDIDDFDPPPIQENNYHQQFEEPRQSSFQDQQDIPEPQQVLPQRHSSSDFQIRKSNIAQEKSQLLTTGHLQTQRKLNKYKGGVILPILKKDPKGKLTVTEELYNLLGENSHDVCLIVVGGSPVSGKSFVLNQLLESADNKKVKQVLNKKFTNQKEGIWLHVEPIITNDNKYLYFLESSGGIYNTISLIFSALFVFNALGEVEVEAMNSVLKVKSLVGSQNAGMLGFMMPSFMWLLRDNMPPPAPNREFKEIFKMYETIILSPPADVKDISEISKLKPNQLNREFTNQILNLRNSIVNRGLTKQYYGVGFNGRMTYTLIEQAVAAVQNNSLDFDNIWERICAEETLEAYNQSMDVYMRAIKIFFNDDQPKSFQELQSILKDIRDSVHERYSKVCPPKNPYLAEYLEKLDSAINTKDQLAFQLNEDLASAANEETLQTVSSDIRSHVQKNLYAVSNVSDFSNEFNAMLDSYNTLGIGMDKCYSMVQFLIAFYPNLIRNLFSNCKSKLQSNANSEDFDKQEKYFQTKLKELYDRQSKLENAIKSKQKQNTVLEQGIQKEPDAQEMQRDIEIQQLEIQQIPNLRQNLKLKEQELAKLKQQAETLKRKKKTGCFG